MIIFLYQYKIMEFQKILYFNKFNLNLYIILVFSKIDNKFIDRKKKNKDVLDFIFVFIKGRIFLFIYNKFVFQKYK